MNHSDNEVHSLVAAQIAKAKLLTIQIEFATKRLAQLMDELHGQECRYMISHDVDAEVVCITPGMQRGGSSRA